MSGVKTLTQTETEKDSTVEHNSNNMFPSQFVYKSKFPGQRTSIPVRKYPKNDNKVEATLSKEILIEDSYIDNDTASCSNHNVKVIFAKLSKTCQKNRAKQNLHAEKKGMPNYIKVEAVNEVTSSRPETNCSRSYIIKEVKNKGI